jgi:poly(hydroxyalkanoate) granule-associated protein
MGKKLKALAGGFTESQLAATVKESAQQIWLAGLGAFAKAQQEGGKVFDALVKEGESIQSRTRKLSDAKIGEVAAKASGTWDRLEQVIEDRVARTLSSLGVPSQKDIDQLAKRVLELTAAVQVLADERASSKAVVKPAAVKKAPAKPEAKAAVKLVVKPVVKKAVPKAVAKPVAPKAVPAAVPKTVPTNKA